MRRQASCYWVHVLSHKAQEDYVEVTAPGLTLTFGPTVLSINVPVTIVNNSILELNETFVGSLNSIDGADSAVTLEPDVATVTIFDDARDRKFLCRLTKCLVEHLTIMDICKHWEIDQIYYVPFMFS